MWACAAVLGALLVLPTGTGAANTPCSGSKGGIDHCEGELFVCNDGSISGSKKNCSAYLGSAGGAPRHSQGLLSAPSTAGGGECSCRSGRICIGPRGGRYCLSDNGQKSYVRR